MILLSLSCTPIAKCAHSETSGDSSNSHLIFFRGLFPRSLHFAIRLSWELWVSCYVHNVGWGLHGCRVRRGMLLPWGFADEPERVHSRASVPLYGHLRNRKTGKVKINWSTKKRWFLSQSQSTFQGTGIIWCRFSLNQTQPASIQTPCV